MRKFLYTVPVRNCVLSQKGVKPLILKRNEFEDSVPYLDINALESGEIKEYTRREFGNLATKNDVLVVWDGSRSGLTLKGRDGVIGSTLMSLTPIGLDTEYLFFFLKSQYDFINGNTTGVGIPHVDSDFFFNLEIPYVPLSQQKEIIKEVHLKLSQNLSFLHQQKEFIKKTLSNINVDFDEDEEIKKSFENFRYAVIKKALSGDLTDKWRVANKQKYDWNEHKLVDVCLQITDGEHQTPKRLVTNTGNILLSAKNIRDGYISYDDVDFISDSDFEKALKRCAPQLNDILMVSVGATIGRCSIVKQNTPFVIVRSVALIRSNPNLVLPEFMLIHLQSSDTQNIIKSISKGDAQPSLYINKINDIPIYMPSIQEQQEIINQTNIILKEIDKLENDYQLTIDNLTNLEKSILQEAFKGEYEEPETQIASREKLLKNLLIEKGKLEISRNESNKFRTKIKNAMKKELGKKKPLEEIIKESKVLTTEELWKESIYFENGEVEQFYEELLSLEKRKQIKTSFSNEQEKMSTNIIFIQNAN